MLWKMSPAITKLLGMMPRSARAIAQTPNATMDNAASVLPAERGFIFTVGHVVRSDMGWYGVLVNTQDRGDIACLVLGYVGNGVVGTEFSGGGLTFTVTDPGADPAVKEPP